MPEAEKAPVEEAKDTKAVETKTETPKEEKTKEEVTVGDALKTVKETKEPKMVPEAVLIEYKKENKEMFKELKELKKLIEEGATKKEVSSDLKALAEKHSVDADFLKEFADAVKKEAEDAANAKLKPIEDEKTAIKLNKIFDENFDKTLSEMPEYAKLVNKDVIKTLAFDPRNANKTFAQIFESSYGHLVTGKKTLETTKARGGAQDSSIDYSKINDSEYFSTIMADPELKKKYEDDRVSRISRYL